MLRPDDLDGTLVLQGRARDVRTDAAGAATVSDEVALFGRVAYGTDRHVLELRSEPDDPRLEALVGTRASSGFRAAVDSVVPDLRDTQALLYLLLDDLPVATLVSGYAVQYGSPEPLRPTPGVHALQHADLCSGWRVGGTIMIGIEAGQGAPVVTGPDAPSIDTPDDPFGWHAMAPLPANGMRRRRRVDVTAGDPVELDAMFRDSHMSPDGVETIVHEYTLRATLDPSRRVVLDIEATPQVLPWVECPSAAASAQGLVGLPLAGLRPYVRERFVGVPTCTHLNDLLRSLEDVERLVALLEG